MLSKGVDVVVATPGTSKEIVLILQAGFWI